MKTARNLTRILTIIFAALTSVLFFFPVVSITTKDNIVHKITGATAAFGLPVDGSKIGHSHFLMFILTLSIVCLIIAAFTFKRKGVAKAIPYISLFSFAIMIAIIATPPGKYIDYGRLSVLKLHYLAPIYLICAGLLLIAVASFCYIFAEDKIDVAESNGKKKPMLQRFAKWLHDFKSEVKKVVWPTRETLFKNTITVLVVCLIIGAFVCLIDYGMDLIFHQIIK